jgi:tripartite-type tricarboxylate transporter receptor subunit TctC
MSKIVKFLLAVSAALSMSLAHAQKPIEIVLPVTAGGAVDQNARALSQLLTNRGIANVVTYHPGAEGDIAYRHAMLLKDNVILVGAHSTFVFSHVNNKRKNFYAETLDLYGPVTMSPQGFITGPNGYNSYKQLVQDAKKQEIPCGVSNSTGTVMLLSFNKEYGTKFVPVPYKGSAPLVVDVGGGHVKCGFDTLASHYPRHEAKQLTILSSSYNNKINVPLIAQEIPVKKVDSWYGFGLPKDGNLAKDQKIISLLKSLPNNQEALAPLVNAGYTPAKINPDLNTEVVRQTEYYSKIMQ